MRKYNRQKKSFIIMMVLLLVLGLGIGYAILTERLTIDNTINYNSMKWDVGFKTAVDGGGSVTSIPVISQDKKTITVECNLENSTSSETCIATAVIENNSTFNVALSENPTITYDDEYIKSVDVVWTSNLATVVANDVIGHGTTKEMKITITTKELTKETLPSTTLSIPVEITMNWVETEPEGGNEPEGNEELTFADKTAIFLGDSVAYGHQTNGNGFGYYINQLESFKSFTNVAKNSATINTQTAGNNNVIEQIRANSGNSYDFVIIEGGYGDLRDVPPLGTITKEDNPSYLDTTTFAGAMEYTLLLAKSTWKNARIGFIVSYYTPLSSQGIRQDYEATKEYWDMAKAICEKYDVPYLDFFEGSAMHNGENKLYSEIFQVNTKTYIADGVHPNAAGYEIITPYIKEWMKTLPISEHVDFEGTYKDGIYTIVNDFKQLSFTATNTLVSTENMTWGEGSTGRASAVNYLVEVQGGEKIGLSNSASNVSYAIKEFNASKTYVGSGEEHKRWINEDITLQSDTRYIVVSFKNGDGTTDFTEEQLGLLKSYIEFK